MNSKYLNLSILFILGILLFSSCGKENIDLTNTTDPPVIPEVTVCDGFQLSISYDDENTLTASVGGNNAPYSYLWSTGDSTQSTNVTESGVYSVVVTDAESCTEEAELTVVFNDCESLELTLQENPLGPITATIVGGTAPYQYLWSDGSTDNSILPNTFGDFSLTITDDEGCTAEASISIQNSCNSFAVGLTENGSTIESTTTGGTAPYFYLWSTGDNTSNITIVTDGTYSLTVEDANGCVTDGSITINNSNPCELFVTEIMGNDSILFSTTSGGTEPYAYLWSTGQTTNATDIPGEGTYSLTVTDAIGCEVIENITVTTEPCNSDVNVYITNPQGNTLIGNIELGTAPFTYLWSTGETTSSISPPSSGTYSVTIEDANGCDGIDSITI